MNALTSSARRSTIADAKILTLISNTLSDSNASLRVSPCNLTRAPDRRQLVPTGPKAYPQTVPDDDVSAAIPPFLTGLVDDAAVFPPGNAALTDALHNHREHRQSWYASLVGPLLLPASSLHRLPADIAPLAIGIVADTGIAEVSSAMRRLPRTVTVKQIEARAGDKDNVAALIELQTQLSLPVFAELPITPRPDDLLDQLVGTEVTPKFRTGGATPQMFPSPESLAEGIVACAKRGLGFKLTAGLHEAIRHTDSATGFVHHGFANVAVAAWEANSGADVTKVTDMLKVTESDTLRDQIRGMLAHSRPLWAGFGSCSIHEPLNDLKGLSLVFEES